MPNALVYGLGADPVFSATANALIYGLGADPVFGGTVDVDICLAGQIVCVILGTTPSGCCVLTPTDVVNQALQMIGNNAPPVTGSYPNFDSSAAGSAAALLYGPVVQTVGRQHGWDFSRNSTVLTATGNVPLAPYKYEYYYPPMGVEVRQVMPQALVDPFNPLPLRWAVCNNIVGGTPQKVIQTNQASAQAVFSNQPPVCAWDPLFREAVVRLLASEMAMAIAGRPDTARDALQSGQGFEKLGEGRFS